MNPSSNNSDSVGYRIQTVSVDLLDGRCTFVESTQRAKDRPHKATPTRRHLIHTNGKGWQANWPRDASEKQNKCATPLLRSWVMIPRTRHSRLFLFGLASTFQSSTISTAEMAQQGADAKVSDPGGGSESESKVPNDATKGRLSDSVLPHILNLYASSATAHDFEIYAQHATFEDPLMCAHGVRQIKSAFYSLPKVFSESKISEYSIQESSTSPGNGEILIDNKQHYKFLGMHKDIDSLIKLQIDNGKVIRHEDWWDKKPLLNRETATFPLAGWIVEKVRRGSMLVTHAMMGFGKDPNP
ncbi:hypothetical protein EJ110_NYTH48219 [Nymphaea thermarum]|nr:hypothetical protein EJ110_NYTH48219 [Nymphaea thermarum]